MKPVTSPTPFKPTTETADSPHELHEKIRLRAHELYNERGRIDGHDLDDWLQAETEVSQAKRKVASTAAA